MRQHVLAFACFVLSVGTTASYAASSCTAQSPAHTVALVELYTSEGCSSCPPADRWLSRLPATGLSAERVVPLAFHVDFWDYLGWRDRFASPAFSDRHRGQLDRQRARFLYTPQVFLDGRDWRAWGDETRVRKEVARINARTSPLSLNVSAAPRADGRIDVDLRAAHVQGEDAALTQVYLALFENGLESRVTAGENKNVRLRHDYVVRQLVGPIRVRPDGKLDRHEVIVLPADLKLQRSGLAAFAESERTPNIRQAIALDLANCVATK